MFRCHPISFWVKVLTLTYYMMYSLITSLSSNTPILSSSPHLSAPATEPPYCLATPITLNLRTWVFFPQRATWLIPYLLSYCSNVGFSVRSSLTTPYKKALVHPQSQYSKVTSSRKSSLISLSPHLPQSGKFFLPSKPLYLTFLVVYWFYLVLHLLGPYCPHYTLGSWREGTVSSSFLSSLSTVGTVNT